MTASDAPDHGAERPASSTGGVVLVVDDDRALRRSIRRSLELHGYKVYSAANAHEARQQVEFVGPPDIVLMDLVLPGMEGREAANLLLAHHPDVKILYMSGYTSQESMRMGLLNPAQGFLRKPFDVPELLEAVEKALA
ncbi:MAG: response regulator [Gemmatimonadetes bacterium]|nr:response regulator [Gemmatimonadota bacterium]